MSTVGTGTRRSNLKPKAPAELKEGTLEEAGLENGAELVAICSEEIRGDFEEFEPGCPTCDYNTKLHRLSFKPDGIVSVQVSFHKEPVMCRYWMGELRETTRGYDKSLEFTRLDPDSNGVPQTFAGTLHLSARSGIRRSIAIPDLKMQVKDLRWLKEMGQEMQQKRLWSLMWEREMAPLTPEENLDYRNGLIKFRLDGRIEYRDSLIDYHEGLVDKQMSCRGRGKRGKLATGKFHKACWVANRDILGP